MDFPQGRTGVMDAAPLGVISTFGPSSQVGPVAAATRPTVVGTTWPSADLAIYMPVLITEPVTVFQMGVEVTTTGGNLDIGIYDESLARVVSIGTTATAAAGLQVVNIADTALVPGLYYWAMSCSSITAAFRAATLAAAIQRVSGGAQQATASPLPATATFATITSSYFPDVTAFLTATTP